MEAIEAIVKRTKAGKYKIDLTINNNAAKIVPIVSVEEEEKKY